MFTKNGAETAKITIYFKNSHQETFWRYKFLFKSKSRRSVLMYRLCSKPVIKTLERCIANFDQVFLLLSLKTSNSYIRNFAYLERKTFIMRFFHNQMMLQNSGRMLHRISLREKCQNTKFFLVRIFLHSVWTQEKTDPKKSVLELFSLSVCSGLKLDIGAALHLILQEFNSWL